MGETGGNIHRRTPRRRGPPYPIDPPGAGTRFGAYDRGRLLADQTPVSTTPALGGEGLIAVSYLFDPPPHPPAPGVAVELHGEGPDPRVLREGPPTLDAASDDVQAPEPRATMKLAAE